MAEKPPFDAPIYKKGKTIEEVRKEEEEVIKRIQEKQKAEQRSRKLWWLWTPPGLFFSISIIALILLNGSFLTRLFWIGVIHFTIAVLIIGTQFLGQIGMATQNIVFLTQNYDKVNQALWGDIWERLTSGYIGLYLWMLIGVLMIMISIYAV